MNELKVYDAVISTDEEGIYVMSLVDEPSTEVNWQLFQKVKENFTIVNEEEHILAGVVMLADTPILRIKDGVKFYIRYPKETIKKMAEKMLADNVFNNVDIQHNFEILPKGSVNLVELFIKDSAKGICPNYVDVPDGTLMANYKVHDEHIWQMAKEGKINGFSLAGLFEVDGFDLNNKHSKQFDMSKIKDIFKKLLQAFGAIDTDKGVLHFEGDAIEVGTEVFDEEGNPAADGEYVADGVTYKVVEGKVEEIVEPAIEEETPAEVEVEAEEEVEETIEETPAEVETVDYEALITALAERVAALEEKVNEILAKPVAEPIEEEFSKVKTNKNNKAAEIAKYLK